MLTSNQEDTEYKQPTYSVKNIVALAYIEIEGQAKLDLISILHVNPNISEYDPDGKFPGLVMKIETPTPRGIIKGTALIFSSGKLILTGLKSESHIDIILNVIVNKVEKAHMHIIETSSKVVNIVSSGSLHNPINLDKAIIIIEQSMYEPEVFPGLIYRMQEPKIVFILFSTGSFIATGTRSREDLKHGVKQLAERIKTDDLIFHTPEYGEIEGQGEMMFI
jgi:transcription initiation factor TFIID TATA-box-binding protein